MDGERLRAGGTGTAVRAELLGAFHDADDDGARSAQIDLHLDGLGVLAPGPERTERRIGPTLMSVLSEVAYTVVASIPFSAQTAYVPGARSLMATVEAASGYTRLPT